MLREYLSNIADKFRTHLDTTEPINAQDFAGKVEDVAVRYNQLGFTSGREIGYNQGLEVGYNSAVKEGTITITGASKTLSISGLPSIPKTLNLFGLVAAPPEDERCFIGSLNFVKDGFSYGGAAKILAALWLRVKKDDNNATGAANGSLTKAAADKNNVFTFENGTLTIDFSYHPKYTFGDNYTYKWIATF